MIQAIYLEYTHKGIELKDILLKTVTPIQDDEEKMILEPFPDTDILVTFAEKAYLDDELRRDLPEGWELLTTARSGCGYSGCAYINSSQQQVVLAHRGSDLWKRGEVYTDEIGVWLGQYTDFMFSAVTFVDDIKCAIIDTNTNDGIRYTLTITGHYVGAWLAQITAITSKHLKKQDNMFTSVSDFDQSLQIHTVAFDSPGVRDMVLQIQRDYGSDHCTPYSMFRGLDITNFFIASDLVNATGFHEGSMYQVSSNLVCTFGFKHMFSNLSMHSLKNFIKAFRANEGKPFLVKHWPQGWAKRTLDKVLQTHRAETEVGQPVGEEDPGTSAGLNCFPELQLDFIKWIGILRMTDILDSHIENLFIAKSLSFQDLFPEFTISKKENVVMFDSKQDLETFVKNTKNALRWFSRELQDAMENQSRLLAPSLVLDIVSLDSVLDLPACEDTIGLREFTENTDQVLYIQSADCDLEMARISNILHQLDNDYAKLKKCVFFDWTGLLKLNKYLKIEDMPLTNDRLLVVNIGSVAENTHQDQALLKQQVLEKVFLNLKTYVEKKVVIISNINTDFYNFVKNLQPELDIRCLPISEQECLEIRSKNLKEEFREELFDRKFIVLGEQALSLNALLGDHCLYSDSIDDVLKPFLNDLLLDESFILNITNNMLKFVKSDVMYSRMNREVAPASLTKLLLEETCSLFVSSGVRELLEPQLQEVPGAAERVLDLAGSSEEDFREACFENSSVDVAYWLTATDGRLLMKQIYNSSFYLFRQFHDTSVDSRMLTEEDLCDRKAVIISDQPGMGKSSILTSLTRHLTDSWPLRMNLKDHRENIVKLPEQMCVESAALFLTSAVCEPVSRGLLKFCLQTKGSYQIHVLFNGFDEIGDKDAMEKVLKLCRFLKNETTAKVIVTTRDRLKDILMNRLSTVTTIFEEISEEKYLCFLLHFWRSHSVLEPGSSRQRRDERLRLFAQHLYDAAHKKLDGDIIRLIGTPLHMKMLAEAYLQQAEQFSGNEEPIPNIIGMHNVYNVYKKFIGVKCNIYLKDKISSYSDVIGGLGDMVTKTITINYCIRALQILDAKFEKKWLHVTLSQGDLNEMNVFGLTQWNRESQCDFIHRTFAEYFCSELLVLWLRRENFRFKYLPIEEWFLGNLLTNRDFKVVRKFLDEHLAEIKLKAESKQLLYNYMIKRWSENYEAFCDEYGQTPLHVAAEENNPSIIDLLLGGLATEQTQGAFESFLLARDCDGNTALRKGLYLYSMDSLAKYTAEEEKVSAVKRIIQKVSHLSYDFKLKLLLLTLLETDLFPSTSELLLKCALNAEYREDFQTAIDRVKDLRNKLPAVFGQVKINDTSSVVDFIYSDLKSDAEREIFSLAQLNGQAAIHIASIAGNLKLVKLFTSISRDVLKSRDIGWRTPLDYAVICGHMDVVLFLLDQRSRQNTNCLDRYGKTPLHYATQRGYLEITKVLVSHGGDVNMPDHYGNTPLHYATREGYLEIIKLFISHGGNINKLYNDGKTPLHYAIKRGDVEIVKVLLSKGGDIGRSDHEGKTPLNYAMDAGNLEIVKALVSHELSISQNPTTGLSSTSPQRRNMEVVG